MISFGFVELYKNRLSLSQIKNEKIETRKCKNRNAKRCKTKHAPTCHLPLRSKTPKYSTMRGVDLSPFGHSQTPLRQDPRRLCKKATKTLPYNLSLKGQRKKRRQATGRNIKSRECKESKGKIITQNRKANAPMLMLKIQEHQNRRRRHQKQTRKTTQGRRKKRAGGVGGEREKVRGARQRRRRRRQR